jgi:hypothetical protein
MSHHQNEGQNHMANIPNKSFENMAKFKYFGTKPASRNSIYE